MPLWSGILEREGQVEVDIVIVFVDRMDLLHIDLARAHIDAQQPPVAVPAADEPHLVGAVRLLDELELAVALVGERLGDLFVGPAEIEIVIVAEVEEDSAAAAAATTQIQVESERGGLDGNGSEGSTSESEGNNTGFERVEDHVWISDLHEVALISVGATIAFLSKRRWNRPFIWRS